MKSKIESETKLFVKSGGIFFLKKGVVYSCGGSGHYQLGLAENKDVFKPTLMFGDKDKKVKSLGLGSFHGFLTTENGDINGWGGKARY